MSNSLIKPDSKLVSFDLWLTLIKSNGKHFKDARNAYMGALLAPGMSTAEFDKIVRKQDKAADAIAETRNEDVLFDERVSMVAMAASAPAPSPDLLGHLYEFQGDLFQKQLPLLLDPGTPDLLQTLRDRHHRLGIVSNTGYIHGDQMRPALQAIGIAEKFDYMMFSNEIGSAKPNRRIFQALLDAAGVEAVFVTHIGDNLRADVLGAEQIGMQAIHFGGETDLKRIVNG